ncbi:MAG: fluoride efflux transporter CrcB [Pseudomonadota bacterium]|nr:fluoride efflux transporter CrcB [Pseudomonadota bacterium]MED5461099.1 fluoride efflux transporter CrcB [Pseudomonadota bacterium]
MKAALINAALVGTGGFIGAIARYGISGLVQRSAALSSFPYGTLAVNMLGCLLIGIAVGLVDSRQVFGPDFKLFAVVGLLGGFTTWSTFGYETLTLLRDAEYLRATANVAIHVMLGLVLVWAGYALASR